MSDLQQHIKGLEESLLRPYERTEMELLDKLLHDDFEEVGSSGRTTYKHEAIRWLIREEENIQWSLSEFRIRALSAELVLAHYFAHKNNLKTGKISNSMRSSLWKKSDDRWSIIFHQGSEISTL